MLKIWSLSRPYTEDGGAAFMRPFEREVGESDLRILLEDGMTIGMGEAPHVNIREVGGGRVSIHNGTVRFSSSDGTDCNTNGRDYQIAIIDDRIFRDVALRRIGLEPTAALSAVTESNKYNNAFFTNFFAYYREIANCLARNNIPAPRSVVEIGSGARPYTGLRFLLSGAERFIACDLLEVQTLFPADFIQALLGTCQLVMPELCARADRVLSLYDGSYSVRGLEAVNGRPFHEAPIEGAVDLIISVSALEHVLEPERTVRKMADVLPSGGVMFHSIDLRDHRDFSKPLEFLNLSEAEYAAIQSENRLRASGWIALLEDAGFEVIERSDQTVLMDSNRSEPTAAGSAASYRFYKPGEKVEPTVTEAERASFAEPFRTMSLEDLSITRLLLLCRKI